MSLALSVNDLSLSYGNSSVVQQLNLEFKKNTFTALVGNNGSGKSTFLRAISGQHKDYSGIISINNQSIDKNETLFKEGTVAFLSQNQEITFGINVKELLLMGRFRFKKIFENYSSEDEDKVEQVASELNIESFLDKSYDELSGGEQQLVLLAQTLIQDADIYLFDEPTQNLDIKNSTFIFDLIKGLTKKNKTVICSTHDLHLLENCEGSIVNFSSNDKQIQELSSTSVKDNINILKKG